MSPGDSLVTNRTNGRPEGGPQGYRDERPLSQGNVLIAVGEAILW